MKITVKQLKQLIREQVEMAMDEGSSDARGRAEGILKQIKDIWRAEAGMIESEGSRVHDAWKRKAEQLSFASPQEVADAMAEQRKQAKEFFEYLKML